MIFHAQARMHHPASLVPAAPGVSRVASSATARTQVSSLSEFTASSSADEGLFFQRPGVAGEVGWRYGADGRMGGERGWNEVEGLV